MSTIIVRFLTSVTKYWTETGTSDVTHGGKAAQLGREGVREIWGRGYVVEMSQFQIMPIVSCFKRLSIYPIPLVRSTCTFKMEKSLIIIYTTQNIKPQAQ